MCVVVIEEAPHTNDHSFKKLRTKAEQEELPRKTPKTRAVTMKVSDAANFTGEKTISPSSHPQLPASG
jgi:hypothetical protein